VNVNDNSNVRVANTSCGMQMYFRDEMCFRHERRSVNEERLVYLQVIFDESVEERDYDIAVPTTTNNKQGKRVMRIGYWTGGEGIKEIYNTNLLILHICLIYGILRSTPSLARAF
jgi:hypothetical protein